MDAWFSSWTDLNPYLRKGEVGGWKDYFTPEQVARLDAIYEARLKAAGLDLEFQLEIKSDWFWCNDSLNDILA